ncbi:hypothetical protein JOM56_012821 [Amanita muscaria]
MRRALDAALNGLDVLKNMYEYRVARWNDEMKRIHQEKEHVFKQLHGDRPPMMTMNGLNEPSLLSQYTTRIPVRISLDSVGYGIGH